MYLELKSFCGSVICGVDGRGGAEVSRQLLWSCWCGTQVLLVELSVFNTLQRKSNFSFHVGLATTSAK